MCISSIHIFVDVQKKSSQNVWRESKLFCCFSLIWFLTVFPASVAVFFFYSSASFKSSTSLFCCFFHVSFFWRKRMWYSWKHFKTSSASIICLSNVFLCPKKLEKWLRYTSRYRCYHYLYLTTPTYSDTSMLLATLCFYPSNIFWSNLT